VLAAEGDELMLPFRAPTLAAQSAALPPLSTNVFFTGGDTINVSGASGFIHAAVGVISIVNSGGVAPITGNGPGGKQVYLDNIAGVAGSNVTITLSDDGTHNTIAWSGLSNVNDLITFNIEARIKDAAGQTASATYPGGVMVIKRMS
jgi:hypothetical protein